MTDDPEDAVAFDFFTLPSPFWDEVRRLRHEVFVIEQGVPPALEQDAADAMAIHLAARLGDAIIGTLRLLVQDDHVKLGRVAVTASHRRRGIARAMMLQAIEHCRTQGISVMSLHAQTSSRALYDSLGFSPAGTVFMEAGLPHIRMDLSIGTA